MNLATWSTRLSSGLLAACLLFVGTGRLRADVRAQPTTGGEARPVEHLFVAILYGPVKTMKYRVEALLRSMRAKKVAGQWTYTNPAQNKDYVIHFVQDGEALKEALYTEGAHIAMTGHANYGLGAVFATTREMRTQSIADIRYIDDARILTTSSPWIGLKIYGLIEHQSFPNWRPVFSDGTSGIMPYDFGDPRGDPPYNYYITYQVPGDPTHYKIETVANSALERFPTAEKPAWYSPDGSRPDPENPDQRQYFITHTDDEFDTTGGWETSAYSTTKEHGDDFLFSVPGSGDSTARWHFEIPDAGRYDVAAWWPRFAGNTAKATFTVYHATGSSAITVNQKKRGGSWFRLGSFDFAAGKYSVLLNNDAAKGMLIADAIQITGAAGTGSFEVVIENTTSPRPHYGRKTIVSRRDLDVDPEQMKYARLYVQSCKSGLYFLETLHRGVTFYTVDDSAGLGLLVYLKSYMLGLGDYEIWAALQRTEPVYDYYDFSQPPPALVGPAAAAAVPVKARAGQTRNPQAEAELGLETQKRIRALASCPTPALLDRLESPEFVADDTLLQRAVLCACRNRQSAALALAFGIVASPNLPTRSVREADREADWTVARVILETFPAAAVPGLVELYARSGAATRANIIRILGNIDADSAVDALLLTALEDKSPAGTESPESDGDPLRLCDLAYNQLVQRYEMDGVLRALGSMHRCEVRDYHIGVLLSCIERTRVE